MAGLSAAVFCNGRQFALIWPRQIAGSSPCPSAKCFSMFDTGYFGIPLNTGGNDRRIHAVKKLRAGGLVIHATRRTMPPSAKTSPSPEVLKIWQNADAVCFDVDSTVCMDEGIDELAGFCGARDAVAAWTSRAMGGSVPFEEALAARLSLFRPSASDVANYLQSNPPRLNSGIEDLVKKLKGEGVHVYLVSGGFRQMIEPVAALLGIPAENIYANRLLFGSVGEFIGFDSEEPTSRSWGKSIAVEQIKKEHGYKTLVMVGDGATDLEARRPGGADVFICYGGVQLRPNVAEGADWLVLSFDDLIKQLDTRT